MPESLLSALKNSIGFIQLKLSDFLGTPSTDKILTEGFISGNKTGLSKVKYDIRLIWDHEGLF